MGDIGNTLTENGYTFAAMISELGAFLGLGLVSALVIAKWGVRLAPWILGRVRSIFRSA